MTTQVYVSEDAEHFAAQAAHWITAAIVEAQDARGVCHLALSGGSTPVPVFRRLSALCDHGAFDPSELCLWLADEGRVPVGDEGSNAGLVERGFLFPLENGRPRFVLPWQDGMTHEAMAERYERLLPERIDVLVLGLGEDGHVASLFPRADALKVTDRRWFGLIGPKPPPERWTMSLPMLLAARRTCMLARGRGKASICARVIEGDDEPFELPAAVARDAAWFLDVEAASALRQPT